jgi:hypothetical protein
MRVLRVGIRAIDSNVSMCSKSISHLQYWTEEKKYRPKRVFMLYNGIISVILIVAGKEKEIISNLNRTKKN